MSLMIPLALAQEKVESQIDRLDVAQFELMESLGFVAASNVIAPERVPPFVTSSMDGFAVIASDTQGANEAKPAELKIVATVAAGTVTEESVSSGYCTKIMTGAPLPAGAEAVVKVEDVKVKGAVACIEVEVEPGNFVRQKGSNIDLGQILLKSGDLITPPLLGTLASVGVTTLNAYRRPVVGVASTGNEIVDYTQAPGVGQLRDSNRVSLLAALKKQGYETKDFGIISDDEKSVGEFFDQAPEVCDALVTTGGVSMGEFDFVKKVLLSTGGFEWMQIAIKPAKPFMFGLRVGTPVFALPGNAVSALVSLELLVFPSLAKMSGMQNIHHPTISAILDSDVHKPSDGKVHYLRAHLYQDGNHLWRVEVGDQQHSHQLAVMANTNALAIVESSQSEGSKVQVMRL